MAESTLAPPEEMSRAEQREAAIAAGFVDDKGRAQVKQWLASQQAAEEPEAAKPLERPSIPEGRITPSQARKMAIDAGYHDKDNKRVDVNAFLRNEGHRPPLKLIRVSGRTKTTDLAPDLFWAVDISEAIRQYCVRHGITSASKPDIRGCNFQGVVLEE